MSLLNLVLKRLQSLFTPEHLLLDEAELWAYGFDNSRRQGRADAVCFPQTHQQVVALISLCYEHAIPVVARGRGTGTSGGCVPLQGGIVISFEKMDKIIQCDSLNRLMIVQPGVTNGDVQRAAKQHGFFWAPDPSSADFCTVGGNLAFNSAGPRAVKYGTVRENTLALRAVTGSGASIFTGTYTTKGVVGYDLTRLIIGSEGTLAIITEAVLKLLPLPETTRTLRIMYRSIEAATAAITRIMAQAITPCALEFMDKNALKLLREHSDLVLPATAEALLLIDVDGPAVAMAEAIEAINQAAHDPQLLALDLAENAQQAQQLWATRKALSPALRHIAPKKINEDVAVPVANIPALIKKLENLAERYAITIVNFGHAGNGNIHVNLLIDPDDPVQQKNAQACLREVFTSVIELQGTISGEHGVGIEKRDFVSLEIEDAALDLMHAIKRQFDPKNILNPGKTLPG